MSRVGGRFDPEYGENCDVRIVSRSARRRWASASCSGSVAGRNHATIFVKMFMPLSLFASIRRLPYRWRWVLPYSSTEMISRLSPPTLSACGLINAVSRSCMT